MKNKVIVKLSHNERKSSCYYIFKYYKIRIVNHENGRLDLKEDRKSCSETLFVNKHSKPC